MRPGHRRAGTGFGHWPGWAGNPVSSVTPRRAAVDVGLPVDQLAEEALLAAVCGGDEEAAVALVRRFQHRVYGVALAVLGDAHLAEDVAQQTFERAWRLGATFDPSRGGLGSWMCSIARNLAIDVARARRHVPVDPAQLLLQVNASADPEALAMAGEDADRLRGALASLPPEQSRALVLAGIAGWSGAEIAAAEGIPLGTAKTRIRTAMRSLRARLSPEYPSHE
jgi:RNA polymerase sigma factor (sigma-70 family)